MAVYYREPHDEPMFVISVAARLVEMHPQTLRYYERAGLLKPQRSRGHIRLYSERDIERLRKIARLVDDLGVNLAGVEVILNLTERLERLQHVIAQHQIHVPELLPAGNTQNLADSAEQATEAPAKRPRRRTKATSSNETTKPKRSTRHG